MNETEARIRDFVETQFRPRHTVDPDTPLFSTGIVDSFGLLQLIAFVEDAFGVKVDPTRHDLEEFGTIEKMALLVSQLHGASPR